MMSKQCKCIKDYSVTCSDYLGDRKHSEVYMLTLFKKDELVYYFKDKHDYYVSNDRKYLRRMNYYCDNVEDMDENEFNEYFEKINKK